METTAARSRPLEVLLVEDDASQIAAYRAVARRFGLNLEITSCTTEVYRLALSRRPDVVVMDLSLEDGLSTNVLHTLRLSPETQDIPVAMISAYAADPRVKETLLRAGASAVLAKPWAVDSLLSLLEELTSTARTDSPR